MKVLIADSVRLFQQLVSSLFLNTGLQPVACSTGQESLATLEQQQFAFICISMHLEDISGIELCKHIRQSKQHRLTPIILFTAEHSQDLLNQALAAGVTETFNKTRDIDQLVAYIKRFTLQHQPIQGNILYVEDTKSLRISTKELLRDRGLMVDGFARAETAWDALQQREYDLVITDIILAGQMSGLSFINKIRRLDNHRGDIPILAITSFDDIARRIELFNLGINDYAIKPVVEEELLARIRYLIGASRAMNRQYQLLGQFMNTLTEGITLLNRDGQVEQVNQAFLQMTRSRAEQIIDKIIVCQDLACGEDVSMLQLVQRTEQQPQWQGEVALAPTDGPALRFSLRIRPLEDQESAKALFTATWHPAP
jgi:DNA-binding response OmpR family regulator